MKFSAYLIGNNNDEKEAQCVLTEELKSSIELFIAENEGWEVSVLSKGFAWLRHPKNTQYRVMISGVK